MSLSTLSAWSVIAVIALTCIAVLLRYRLRWWTVLLCAVGAVLIISFFDLGN